MRQGKLGRRLQRHRAIAATVPDKIPLDHTGYAPGALIAAGLRMILRADPEHSERASIGIKKNVFCRACDMQDNQRPEKVRREFMDEFRPVMKPLDPGRKWARD